MLRKVLARVSLAAVVGVALNTASCGPTCPAGEQNCGSVNGSSGDAAGTSSTTTTTTCSQLSALQACFTAFCTADGAGTPFCACYSKGFDLSGDSCTCISFDSTEFCSEAADIDAAVYDDCSVPTGAIASMCVGVQ